MAAHRDATSFLVSVDNMVGSVPMNTGYERRVYLFEEFDDILMCIECTVDVQNFRVWNKGL